MSQISLMQMSFSGGAMICVIVLIRLLGLSRLPKRLFPVLWSLALIRLLFPFSLPAAFSVYSLISQPDSPAPQVSVFAAGAAVTHSPAASAVWEEATPATAPGSAPAVNLLGLVWFIGTLACAVWFTAVYWGSRRKFREALPVSDDYVDQWLWLHKLRRPVAIRQSDRIPAPLTYRVLRPVILLPKSTDWKDREALEFVLAHEWVHIRRWDALSKLALAAALCVHWFNPLVWVMLVLANRDMELACDEGVLRLFGQNCRTGYAMALLRMEEKKSGLGLAGSHFSKTPIEERIGFIMKMNQNSVLALALALGVTAGAVGLFATSAKAETPAGGEGLASADAPIGYTVEERDSLLSRRDADGTTYYSWDNGETWTAMTDEEFAQAYPTSDVEWWTAEAYADWLEQEKESLQSIIGSKGWTASTGWFTWTQEKVDETIAEYEEILTMLQNGYRVSKTVDGSEDTMLVMNPLDQILGSGSGEVTEAAKEDFSSSLENVDYDALFADYKRCGLTSQDNGKSLYWNGQRVRIFVDGAEVGGGFTTQYEHYDLEGQIDLHTVRERVDNGDGSYNPMGPLVKIEEFAPDKMFLDALECQSYVGQEIQYEAEHTARELERYAPFGLTGQTDSRTGKLTMDWNGQPVRSLFDPERQLWIANSLGGEGLDLEAVYKNGTLTGLRVSENGDREFVETGAVIDAETSIAESSGDTDGETIAQRMEAYAPYGVSYQESGGEKRISYKGQGVTRFTDMRPDGGVFSVESTAGGEISLVTVYDQNGKLSGVTWAENSTGGVDGFHPCWPLPGVTYVSDEFGGVRNHGGMDIAGPFGTPIVAAESGTVVRAWTSDTWGMGWGYHVMIYHNGTYSTLYAHMSSVAVSEGQTVSQGQIVGYEGSADDSTAPHLHFEVYENGTRVNPRKFL